MANRINFYKRSLEEISKLNPNVKPKLLMHVCCGPCSCFPLTFLCPHFDVTLFFNNSNIYPHSEYSRRLEELKRLLNSYKKDFGYDIKIIVQDYKYDDYIVDLKPYEDDKEGGHRCVICYEKRMDEAYKFASQNNYDYFCTVMTISRQKNSQILNAIGKKLEKKYPNTKYFYSDFKKQSGIDKGQELASLYNLYRQTYCGCEFSIKNQRKDDSKD